MKGRISTLCAGCGHDSISAALIQACFELDIEPHRVAKLSGIGCSSKTPDYFLGQSHGFNSVHGRMPSVLTGANLANRDLIYLGVSGDGDSASIGLGQFAHCVRRGVNMVYICENNGVYGLTKGQFSATADKGSQVQGRRHQCEFADRSRQPRAGARRDLRGAQLLRRQEAARAADQGRASPHQGSAILDVISPCVQFNNHAGSTKSFDFVREHNEAVNRIDFIAGAQRDQGRLRARHDARSCSSMTAPISSSPSCIPTTIRPTAPRAMALSPGAPGRGRSGDRPALCRSEARRPARASEDRRRSRSIA